MQILIRFNGKSNVRALWGEGRIRFFYVRARVHNIAPTSTWPRPSRQQLFTFSCADSPNWSRTRMLDADVVGNQRIGENEMKHLKSFWAVELLQARAGNQRNYIPRCVLWFSATSMNSQKVFLTQSARTAVVSQP